MNVRTGIDNSPVVQLGVMWLKNMDQAEPTAAQSMWPTPVAGQSDVKTTKVANQSLRQ